MKRFAALVGLVLLVALPMARAQQNPDDQYIAIYNLMQQADTLQANGQPREALADYTQALAGLQKLQKVFPYWEPEIVTYRLNYLTDKINGLAAQLPPLPQNGVAPATNAVSRRRASAAELAAQLNALRAQVQGLQQDNETLQAKLKEALRVQPATVDTQELARAQARVLALMKENDLLRASLNTGATNVAPGTNCRRRDRRWRTRIKNWRNKRAAPTSWRRIIRPCSQPPASTRWKRPRWRIACNSGNPRPPPRRRKPATR